MSTPLKKAEETILTAWRAASGHWLNGSNETLREQRRSAIDRIETSGLPAERDEAWKYTNIRRVLDEFGPVPQDSATHSLDSAAIDALTVPGLDAHLVVVVDGAPDTELSNVGQLPDGVVVSGLSRASVEHPGPFNRHFGAARPDSDDGMVDLNTAFTSDGVFVYVPADTAVERPIQVLFVSTGRDRAFVQPRALFVAEEGASVRIVESWRATGDGATFTNAVTECIVHSRARIDHMRIVDDADTAVHVHNLEVYQDGDSHFATNTITLGGGTVRNNAYFLPNGENCETHLLGFTLSKGSMHVDNHTLVDHAKPECFSNELYKGILDGTSTGVFNGKVLVRQDAQKINAYQSNKSVLLSDAARMYSKPELEIYADDVRCSHGATTGQLDEEALFYLRTRGLRLHDARLLILQAFAGDVIEQIGEEAVRTYVSERIARLLQS